MGESSNSLWPFQLALSPLTWQGILSYEHPSAKGAVVGLSSGRAAAAHPGAQAHATITALEKETSEVCRNVTI
eukprot:SAG31_NODE_704_length_12701_cov_17.271306_4_plen_73_part_00